MKNLTLIGSTYKVQRQNEIMTKVTQNQRTIEIAKQRYQSMTYIRFYGNCTICRVKFIRPHVNAQYGFTRLTSHIYRYHNENNEQNKRQNTHVFA